MSELSTKEIIRSYFEQNNILAKHQIESYNDYVDNIIPNILSQFSPIHININNDTVKKITLILHTNNIYNYASMHIYEHLCIFCTFGDDFLPPEGTLVGHGKL